ARGRGLVRAPALWQRPVRHAGGGGRASRRRDADTPEPKGGRVAWNAGARPPRPAPPPPRPPPPAPPGPPSARHLAADRAPRRGRVRRGRHALLPPRGRQLLDVRLPRLRPPGDHPHHRAGRALVHRRSPRPPALRGGRRARRRPLLVAYAAERGREVERGGEP